MSYKSECNSVPNLYSAWRCALVSSVWNYYRLSTSWSFSTWSSYYYLLHFIVVQMEDNHVHGINCKTNDIFTASPALWDHQIFLTSNFLSCFPEGTCNLFQNNSHAKFRNTQYCKRIVQGNIRYSSWHINFIVFDRDHALLYRCLLKHSK